MEICDVRNAFWWRDSRNWNSRVIGIMRVFAPSTLSATLPCAFTVLTIYIAACKRFDANANGSCQLFFFPLPDSSDRIRTTGYTTSTSADVSGGGGEGRKLISYLFKLAIRPPPVVHRHGMYTRARNKWTPHVNRIFFFERESIFTTSWNCILVSPYLISERCVRLSIDIFTYKLVVSCLFIRYLRYHL